MRVMHTRLRSLSPDYSQPQPSPSAGWSKLMRSNHTLTLNGGAASPGADRARARVSSCTFWSAQRVEGAPGVGNCVPTRVGQFGGGGHRTTSARSHATLMNRSEGSSLPDSEIVVRVLDVHVDAGLPSRVSSLNRSR